MNIKESKRIVQELQTGIHLATISKVGWVFEPNAAEKKILVNKDGDKAFEVVFVDNSNHSFKNTYWVGGEKQKFFEKMLSHIGINPKNPMKAKEIVGKRLYIAICELVEIDGDVIVLDEVLNEEVKNHYIFKTYPFFEGAAKPYIEGDPAISGVATGEFRKYKEIGSATKKTVAKKEVQVPKTPITEKSSAGMVPNTDFAKEKQKVVEKPKATNDDPCFDDEPEPKPKATKKDIQDVFDDEPNFD